MAIALSQQYNRACTDLNQPVNQFIEVMFRQYTSTLKICGNNRLVAVKRVTDEDFLAISRVLKENNFITNLDLRFNNLTNNGAAYIAKFLQDGCSLFHLNLMGNDIEIDGAGHIAKALHRNDTLRSLRMTGNKIGNKGAMFFAAMLQINSTLEALDLGDCDLGIESLIAFSTVLKQNDSIKSINLNRPLFYVLQEDTTNHIARMLKVNNTLKEIHLSKHEMTDSGVERLCEALHENRTLKYLDLSCNKITRDGVKCLANLLKTNAVLEILDLTSNRMEDEGAIYLAEAIHSYNHSLRALAIVSNNITGQGLKALAAAIKVNKGLEYIYIWGNVLDEDACLAFSELLLTGRLSASSTDVQPCMVDGRVYLAELFHGLKKHYYWTPSYGIADDPVCNSSLTIINDHTS
ncbi:leucine-rich repeat-containing protein 34 isoform X2 [Hyla sarda]|uniref:leucine-rich repeat-containing protein 34 isoform X2 n=1 Tax=Hyla sarda TaxID=327740 RepID=UPI0024C34976|nr:leucine-rich repeat-containing protein 34 isoform X2 [Hyla sarda]XP_056421106.1 leucine-rich repeat-containing protein 34 isoform X2 [Hyla sarda]XP_056421107.1 leucine-rich repeat-containing protein 34 isoform X2 [Hyla sarda]XP_056421109.1 leucine-rich repeat-containing protein 34 isoform X2 [Hyla sarda]